MHRPSPDELSPADAQRLVERSVKRLERGGPNQLHMRRLYFTAEPFVKAGEANVHIVRAAALLHDATKEDGTGEPKERFCTHGEREPIEDSALTGRDSAWKSVNDAQQTLLTVAAQKCGAELTGHTRRFLDGVKWSEVKDVPSSEAQSGCQWGLLQCVSWTPAI